MLRRRQRDAATRRLNRADVEDAATAEEWLAVHRADQAETDVGPAQLRLAEAFAELAAAV